MGALDGGQPRSRRVGEPLLGRIHSLLRDLQLDRDAATPLFANHIGVDDLVPTVAAATDRVRSWTPTDEEARLADVADQLAEQVAEAERSVTDRRPQLVHGDFWDNNVLFRGEQVALVADFDFLGDRPRVDDLALTLYFVSLDIHDLADDPAVLAELVTAYTSELDIALSDDELAAIPLAMARQPLWSIGVWVALLDDEAAARRHLEATAAHLSWASGLMDRRETLQDALVP